MSSELFLIRQDICAADVWFCWHLWVARNSLQLCAVAYGGQRHILPPCVQVHVRCFSDRRQAVSYTPWYLPCSGFSNLTTAELKKRKLGLSQQCCERNDY